MRHMRIKFLVNSALVRAKWSNSLFRFIFKRCDRSEESILFTFECCGGKDEDEDWKRGMIDLDEVDEEVMSGFEL